MEYAQHMQSRGNFLSQYLHRTFIDHLFSQNIPATALSSAICLTTVPLRLKKIFILWGMRGRHGCLQKKPCCSVRRPCAQSLHFSAHYPPGERALSVIVLKPTQPLTVSHASSQISLIGLFHPRSGFPQTSIPPLDPPDFLIFVFPLIQLDEELWRVGLFLITTVGHLQ